MNSRSGKCLGSMTDWDRDCIHYCYVYLWESLTLVQLIIPVLQHCNLVMCRYILRGRETSLWLFQSFPLCSFAIKRNEAIGSSLFKLLSTFFWMIVLDIVPVCVWWAHGVYCAWARAGYYVFFLTNFSSNSIVSLIFPFRLSVLEWLRRFAC